MLRLLPAAVALTLLATLATALISDALALAPSPAADLLATRDALIVQATRLARDIAATERAFRATVTAQVRDAEATRAAVQTRSALAFEATREAIALLRAAATATAEALRQPTATPLPTPTPVPTATPIPTPTATPAPTPDPTARAAVAEATRRPVDVGDLIVLGVGAGAILVGALLAVLSALLRHRREARVQRVHVPAEIIPPGGRMDGAREEDDERGA